MTESEALFQLVKNIDDSVKHLRDEIKSLHLKFDSRVTPLEQNQKVTTIATTWAYEVLKWSAVMGMGLLMGKLRML